MPALANAAIKLAMLTLLSRWPMLSNWLSSAAGTPAAAAKSSIEVLTRARAAQWSDRVSSTVGAAAPIAMSIWLATHCSQACKVPSKNDARRCADNDMSAVEGLHRDFERCHIEGP